MLEKQLKEIARLRLAVKASAAVLANEWRIPDAAWLHAKATQQDSDASSGSHHRISFPAGRSTGP
jgi:hypothetical protein